MLNVKVLYKQWAKGCWRLPVIRHIAFVVLRWLLHEEAINQILSASTHTEKPLNTFIDKLLTHLGVSYQCTPTAEAAFPQHGRCLLVANHPLGGLDGLLLLHALLAVRDDVKILANAQLQVITPLKPYMIAIDVWQGCFARAQAEAIYRALADDYAVIIFPAGEVSSQQHTYIGDRPWSKGFCRLARMTATPIMPIFIDAHNRRFFYWIRRFFPRISTLLLINEMWHHQGHVIHLWLGQILGHSFRQLPLSDTQLANFLHARLHRLAKGGDIVPLKTAIAAPRETHRLQFLLSTTCQLLYEQAEYSVYLHEPQNDTTLRDEIGRLREEAFRAVGEGSGRARDLDSYDEYYQHLLVWHNEKQMIVGAYRLLSAISAIGQHWDLSRLYTHHFFVFTGACHWLNDAIELGRGFVCPAFWRSRVLDVLWQGIGAYYVAANARYLFGSVSIPAHYPREAIDWLSIYFQQFYAAPDGRELVQARLPYIVHSTQRQQIKRALAGLTRAEAEAVLKKQLQHMNVVIPPLFKHYASLCEEGGVIFGGFCVDPDFGGCVDGFVRVDMSRLRAQKFARYIAPHTL